MSQASTVRGGRSSSSRASTSCASVSSFGGFGVGSVPASTLVSVGLAAQLFGLALRFFVFVGIGDGRGDDVAAAGPFAEIDQSAAFATERELRLSAQHDGAANRTAQRADSFLRHRWPEAQARGPSNARA